MSDGEAMSGGRRALLIGAAGVGLRRGRAGRALVADARRGQGEEAKLLGASFEGLDGGKTDADVDLAGQDTGDQFLERPGAGRAVRNADFVKAQKDFGGKGLQFVGIAVDRREPVERFVKEIGVNYPVLLADVAWLDELKTMGNPQSVLPFSLAVSPPVKCCFVGRSPQIQAKLRR